MSFMVFMVNKRPRESPLSLAIRAARPARHLLLCVLCGLCGENCFRQFLTCGRLQWWREGSVAAWKAGLTQRREDAKNNMG